MIDDAVFNKTFSFIQERNQRLQNRAAQLEKQIKVLIDDSVALLKARMSELGINATSPVDLLAKAKEIVCRHKELQAKASKLQVQVANLEQEQNNLVLQRQQEITDKYINNEPGGELSPTAAQEYILREISSTLAHRKKLHSQVSRLEGELLNLEKSTEERKQAQAIMNRQQQPAAKLSRKSREYRTRSQDWPDVPDIAKIEEQNPEILAQKILETGRKIEASKLSASSKNAQSTNNLKSPSSNNSNTGRGIVRNNMPAPMPNPKRPKTSNNYNHQRSQEPPKLANFEDRLKSIITSVLNEDQQNRAKSQNGPVYSPTSSQFPTNPSTNASQQPNYNYNNFQKTEEKPKYNKYSRCETVVRPAEENRAYSNHQEGLASMVECYRDTDTARVSPQVGIHFQCNNNNNCFCL